MSIDIPIVQEVAAVVNSFADEVEVEMGNVPSGPPCNLRREKPNMDEEFWEELVEVLNDRRYSGASIGRRLLARGIHVTDHTINKCRRECRCGIIREPSLLPRGKKD